MGYALKDQRFIQADRSVRYNNVLKYGTKQYDFGAFVFLKAFEWNIYAFFIQGK